MSFQRFVREITQNFATNMRFQTVTLTAIQKTVEVFLIMFFENKMSFITLEYHTNSTDTNMTAIHAKRVTIQIKNMQFMKNLLKKHQMTDF